MSICVVDGGPCQCQPSEGFPCPGVTALRAEATQLRQYLDTAQRRASALGDEVAGLREDAMRYRWLRDNARATSEHWGGRWSLVVEGPAPGGNAPPASIDAAIDAARKGTT